jgi:uncharacterized phage protein (TIGR02220 family)
MREFAKVSPHIWTSDIGRKIKNLGRAARIVSLYLLTSPSAHMTGVYYIPVVLIAHEADLSVEEATTVINNLCMIGYCSYDYEYEYVWVHGMGVDQVAAQLKANDNRIKAINSMYSSLPKLSFLQNFYYKYADLFLLDQCHEFITPLQAPSKTLRSNEKENEKEKENDNENKNEKKTLLSGKPDIADEEQIFSIEKLNESFEEHGKAASLQDQAKEILTFLNEKTKCRFRLEDANVKLVVTRLKSGASVDECRAVIARKYRDWHGTDMQKYLRPATLFNAIKFEQYLGECVVLDADHAVLMEEGSQDEIE